MQRILKRSVLLVAAALLVPAAGAAASGTPATTTTTTTPTPTPAPIPAPKPKAVKGKLALRLPGIYVVRGDAVTVRGRATTVSGVVRPFVPDQSVEFKATIGNHVVKRTRLRIRPAPSGRYGRFSFRVASSETGIVNVTAVHRRTSAMSGFSDVRRFAVLASGAGFGSTGRFVQLIQSRLAALHFYIPQTGVYDNGTGLAIDAYHRLLGWGTSESLDGRTISYLLNGWGEFKVRYPKHGRHAEGNLGKQLLALADGSKVELIFPISSGKPSTPTVLGDFHVYQRDPGYLSDGMYFSDFFTGGYAIHGYDPAPDYPASHGCMRLPIPDATTAYNWLAMGDWVDVYY
jgi:hypothetical protein